MILDPFGNIIAECRSLGNEIISADITADKLTQAGGYRYTNARRPELYKEIIGKEHKSEQKVAWLENDQTS
ncbi:MAG: nitrilase/cyanide hydratase and apolipoprotein N-acyltransferase [uncultured bacterium]|nr:MAG: nitrilase/cyanide hydratase and apolipoprotein N-acyltransferase [uncultured bacterium]